MFSEVYETVINTLSEEQVTISFDVLFSEGIVSVTETEGNVKRWPSQKFKSFCEDKVNLKALGKTLLLTDFQIFIIQKIHINI